MLLNYYVKFIPGKAELLEPLRKLLKKDVQWEWTDDAQFAFDEAKKILASEPVIHIFDPDKETILYTDASNVGIGAVLKQRWPRTKDQDTIGYFSRPLLKYRKNYSTVEHELLAIISSTEDQ